MNQSKNKSQFIGGIAGIIEACLYVFGFVLLFSFLKPAIEESTAELERLKFILDSKALYQVWITLIYVVFGIVLIPLTISIYENFEKHNSIWSKSIPIFGFIWSGLVIASGMITIVGINTVENIYASDSGSALTLWRTIGVIQNGLGGGVEIIGGLWVCLISITGLKLLAFNKFLNYFGLIVGSAGILTIIPYLKELGAIFGLTQIIWFVWIGIIMIKKAKVPVTNSL